MPDGPFRLAYRPGRGARSSSPSGAACGAAARPDDRRPRPTRSRAALDLGLLALLGLALVALSGWMARCPLLPGHPHPYAAILLAQLALYGLAAGWVIRRRPGTRPALAVIVLVALAARLAFVPQAPAASDDIYRYVWDGRIQAHGMNPYRYAPGDAEVARYRDEAIYPGVNRKGVPTIYPPVAQAVFRVVYQLHPDSVVWTKLAFILVDLAAIGVLAGLLPRLGLRAERVLLYAWHPLLILELGHSGHVDVVAVLFLALALRARVASGPIRAGVLLACAALVKLYAVVALPALLRPDRRADPRLPLAFAATVGLAYLPFLGVGTRVLGYLPGYAREEGIVSGQRFYLLQGGLWLAGRLRLDHLHWPASAPLTAAQWYQGGTVAVMAGLALWCWLRPLATPRDIAGRAALLFVALLALATPSQPWYTLLLLALVPLVGRDLLLPASLVVGAAGFGYLHWWWPGWPDWPLAIAYGGRALALAAIVSGAVAPPLYRSLCRWRRSTVRHRPPAANRPRPTGWGPRPAGTRGASGPHAGPEPVSLFDRFPWFYAFCREALFRDHTERIVTALWPTGSPPAGNRLLELGCGPGFYARRLATRFPQLRVTGVDRSAGQLRHARSRSATQQLDNCRFEWGDVLALPRPAGAVDAVVVSRLFTILPEREGALAEMHRVLRPGGRCFLAEPRSRVCTAVPLRALWLLARLAACRGAYRGAYLEPRRATVLAVDEFAALVRSQPWGQVQLWHDAQYHYAVCEKRAAEIARLVAD